jgi:hypothetical protein
LLNSSHQNGAFIEKHEFPHFFIPGGHDSFTRVVLGREFQDKFFFMEVKVRYGFGLALAANVIHSDSASDGLTYVGFNAHKHDQANSVKMKLHTSQTNCGFINPYPDVLIEDK